MKAKLTIDPKTRRYVFLTFLVFSLMTPSCALLGGGEEGSSQATQPPSSSSDKEVQVVSPHALKSFRGRATAWIQFKDGSETTETRTMEWVQNPRAGHYVFTKSGGEVEEQILMNDTEWTRLDDGTWLQRGATHSEGGHGAAFLAAAHDVPVAMFLPFLLSDEPAALSKMTLEGEETVDSIHCKRYVDDSTVVVAGSPVEMHREIWVADEGALPSVPVRIRFQMAWDLEDTDTREVQVEISLHDLNAPIAIEPPENTVTQKPTAQPADTPVGLDVVELTSLDTLESYRGRLTIRVKLADGSETTQTRTLEWVGESPSGHYVHTKPDQKIEEQIVIGDRAWVKVSADAWSERVSVHGPGGQGFDYLSSALPQLTALDSIELDGSGSLTKMTLLGSEVVNGVQCKHYLWQEPTPHVEVWVADQSGLPAVLVRVLVQASGIHESETELGLYDMNAPITIEPPQ